MLKRALIMVAIVAAILAFGFTYVLARFRDRDAIVRAQQSMEQLRGQRDSLVRHVARLDSVQHALEGTADSLVDQTDSLRREVRELESTRQANQLSVRRIRRPADLATRIRETFPEIAGSDWGVTEIVNDRIDPPIGIQYLVVPLWFSETFLIDHQNAASYKAQTGRLTVMDSLQQQTIALKDTIIRLEQEKTEAFRVGYDSAYKKYEALNVEYINVLKNPRVALRFPGAATLIGSAAAGALVGAAIAR
ncbi:MAG: hypothetical protein ACREMX_14115 [Gemmatimonadales bacterium]